ncbi:class I SAM-dependent methyltransferase [Acidiferrimicrobium sp. IK]|uniref:class I SAM-dependent methyltransferase n=1 Tax=Acidiferrimicrobium sp. IK TaxID=2871700 RepID=UPI0021CB3925|nr:class I SAM-dependent methyltransferase [Acidiferrimicrobium sp. IK]MCU4185571.1 class I SAM-dependent methyltransferase [Acidiferrimicrobium sp. IK]
MASEGRPGTPSLAFSGNDRSAARWFGSQTGWWESHYLGAVDSIVDFLAGDGIGLEGKRLVDLGCGDGTITLGLAQRTAAASVLGLDLQPVDAEWLAAEARRNGVAADAPTLRFEECEAQHLPVEDSSLDLVTAWSVFEHVAEPGAVLAELHRVLRPDGLLFIQIWPMWFSEHGSHLWPWFDQGFAHLRLSDVALRSEVRARCHPPELAEAMLDLYDSCSRVSLDDLGHQILESGFFLAKVEVDAPPVHIPAELQHLPVSLLTTAGVRLLAVRH